MGMTTGRRPLPKNVKLLRGNPGRRPLNDDEPEPPSGRPRAPEHVVADAEAHREWKRTCDTLDDMGLLSKADRPALAAYCLAWSRWVEAETKLRQFGMIIKSPSDYPMTSPYLSIARDSMTQMTRLLVEFGLTPSSRTRLVASRKPADDVDAFDAWEARGAR